MCYFKMIGRNWFEREVKGGFLWVFGKIKDRYYENLEGGYDERFVEGEIVYGESFCIIENFNG